MQITSVSWLGLTSMCHFHPNIACSCELGQSKFVAVSNYLALEGTDLSRIEISIPGIVKVSCLAANLQQFCVTTNFKAHTTVPYKETFEFKLFEIVMC